MKLQGLRALIAIAELGTFSEAALELGTSQSGVSAAIAELEQELGVRLLDRGRFGAAPTDVGRRVLAHARRLEGVLEAIRQEAALETGCLTGSLRVSAFRSAASKVLPPVMARLRDQHPGLRVEVQELPSRCVDVTDSLHAGTVDIALTMSFLAADAIYWELFRDEYVAVVPAPAEPLAQPAELASLLGRPIILSDGPCSIPPRDRLVDAEPTFVPAFEISEDSTILGLVAQGLGVAVMPALTVEPRPQGVEVVRLAEKIERSVGVALQPAALKTPAVRAFLNAVVELHPDGEVPRLGALVTDRA